MTEARADSPYRGRPNAGIASLFGGDVERDGGSVRERTAAVRDAAPSDSLRQRGSGAADGGLGADAGSVRRVSVVFETDPPAARYESLGESTPLSAADHGAWRVLEAYAEAAGSLAQLHRGGAVHGLLRPEWVRSAGGAGDERTVLLVPKGTLSLGPVVGAWVAAFGPAATASLAPELFAEGSPTPAGDVYALAAALYEALSGAPPAGQLRGAAWDGVPASLRATLAQALSQDPALRPEMDAFARATGRALATEQHRMRAAERQTMSSIMAIALGLGGLFVVTGAVWCAWLAWTHWGAVGRAVLLAAVPLGLAAWAIRSLRCGYRQTGLALTAVVSQLLWADAAYILSLLSRLSDVGVWAGVAGAITLITLAPGVGLHSPLLVAIAAVDYLVLALLVAVQHDVGGVIEASLYWASVAFLAAAVAAALLALDRRLGGSRHARLDVPFVVVFGAVGALTALGSTLAHSTSALFAVLFPYGLLAVLAAMAHRPPLGLRGWPSGVGATVVMVCLPWVHAALHDDDLRYTGLAIAVGLAFGAGAMLGRAGPVTDAAPERGGGTRRVVLVLACISGALFTPLTQALADVALWPSAQLWLLTLSCGLTLLISVVGASRLDRKLEYRLLEVSSLGVFYAAYTIGSVEDWRAWFYPAVLFSVGTVVLAFGVVLRRLVWASLSAAALALNLCVQYFGKLKDILPMSLLVLLFGLALLAVGAFFERQIRPRLTAMRGWK